MTVGPVPRLTEAMALDVSRPAPALKALRPVVT